MREGFIFLLFMLSGGMFVLQAEGAVYLSDSTRQLQEVTVVEKQFKEIIPAQKLSGDALQRLSSHSVADAVRFFSGVQIKDYGGVGGLKTVDIRSMGTNHIGVFYDGIQLGNAQNGQIDLGKFSLDNLEEISLYNGQKSEIFQPAKDFGSAGTIYLRTRRPEFDSTKNYNLRGILRGGSFALVNPSFLWEHKITNNISSSLNAEYIYSSGKYKFRYRRFFPDGTVAYDTTAIRQNGDINALRIEGAIYGNHPARSNSQWNVKAYFYNSERGIPGAIVNNVWKRAQRQWDRNFFVQGTFQSDITNWFKILANAKYANDYLRYFSPIEETLPINNYFIQQEAYTSVAAKFTVLPIWDISLASDFQWNTLNAWSAIDTAHIFAIPQRYTTLLALSTSLQVWRFKLQANLLGSFIYDKTPTMKKQLNKLTPAVYLSFQPIKKQDFHIRTFYKRVFRMPTFNDLYYADNISIISSLKPEYATQYNAGLYFLKTIHTRMTAQKTQRSRRANAEARERTEVRDRVSNAAQRRDLRNLESSISHQLMLQTDIYYNEVKDKIIAIPKTSLYRWMMVNIGLAKIFGIDVKAHYAIILPHDITLRTNINYTYQQARDFSKPGTEFYKGQIPYIPWHSASATLGFSYKTWRFNYCFIYVGKRYANSANIQENYQLPWYTSDLSFAKDFKFKRGVNLNLSAEINNILNQQFDVVENYPMPGINFKIICKIKF